MVKDNLMKVENSLFFIGLVFFVSGCSGRAPFSGYSLEGYNNSGYSGDYQRVGGFDDASVQEARKAREQKEIQSKKEKEALSVTTGAIKDN